MRRRPLPLALGAALVVAAAACAAALPAAPRPAAGAGARVASAVTLPAPLVRFAPFSLVPLGSPDAPRYAGPPTPHSLAGVRVAPVVRRALARPGVRAALLRNGFVVVPGDLRLFHFAYDENLYQGWPVYVTTDVAYHEWHLAFDKILRGLEQDVLLPKLERLVAGALAAAGAQRASAAGTPVAQAASRAEQLLQVAAAELGLRTPLGPLARREKALVDGHARLTGSPVTGARVDYSLFAPRGHYTRSPRLRRYFVAMSVLGQSAFCLPGTRGCAGTDSARIGLLASRALVSSGTLASLWRAIYEPTAFLVGTADDYTPVEVAAAARRVLPGGLAPRGLASDAAVRKVASALLAARRVSIDPERASIRLMGARFVVDSFVLDQLLWPNVGTASRPRLIPSGLDLAAAFGSRFAYDALRASGSARYARYDTQLAGLRKALARRPAADWGATVYDAWLSALEPSFAPHGRAFPDTMRTAAWTAKAHQSALGSYAELKHDTILLAKQAMAEGGDGGPYPVRRNWVEPEPVVFSRLAAVADLTRRGLAARGLLTPEHAGILRTEIGLFRFLERIARGELRGRTLSDRDNQRLTGIGSELEALYWRTGDRPPSAAPETDQDAAVVADVARGGDRVLELGTGRVDRIYVLVPGYDGAFQVAAGGVYSYYEFATAASGRLTDEAWRARLDAGKAPARPAWERAFLPWG